MFDEFCTMIESNLDVYPSIGGKLVYMRMVRSKVKGRRSFRLETVGTGRKEIMLRAVEVPKATITRRAKRNFTDIIRSLDNLGHVLTDFRADYIRSLFTAIVTHLQRSSLYITGGYINIAGEARKLHLEVSGEEGTFSLELFADGFRDVSTAHKNHLYATEAAYLSFVAATGITDPTAKIEQYGVLLPFILCRDAKNPYHALLGLVGQFALNFGPSAMPGEKDIHDHILSLLKTYKIAKSDRGGVMVMSGHASMPQPTFDELNPIELKLLKNFTIILLSMFLVGYRGLGFDKE